MVVVINNNDKQVVLYSGGLIFGGGAYIWNEVSVSTRVGLYTGGGLIFGGGLYSKVYGTPYMNLDFWVNSNVNYFLSLQSES